MSPIPDQAAGFDPPARLRQRAIAAGLAIAALALTDASGAIADPTLQTLHRFTGGNEGAHSQAALIMDGSGALYGTTWDGGKHGVGVAFRLTPPAAGKVAWTETVLHAFGSTSNDGQNSAAALLMDGSGALYGTTGWGGRECCGTVFKLTPPEAGKTAWTEAVIRNLINSWGDLITDGSGALYGAAQEFVFKVTPPAAGKTVWPKTVLHKFTGHNGEYATAGLIMDQSGALYGTTVNGGKDNLGVVFRLTPPAVGTKPWTETVLHGFAGGHDGANPRAGLVMDGSGALYGTTEYGGQYEGMGGYGVVFKLTPPAAGQTAWTETVLHAFGSTRNDGAFSVAGLIMDGSGALYGTTSVGGPGDAGVVFKLVPPAAGATAWTETVLYSFTGGEDGGLLQAGLFMDGSGALYGTTTDGGDPQCSCGTVFKLTP